MKIHTNENTMATALIQARVDKKIKDTARKILAPLGLTPADATRLFFHQVVLHKDLPFTLSAQPAHAPNSETRAVLEKSAHGEDVEHFDDVESMIASFKK